MQYPTVVNVRINASRTGWIILAPIKNTSSPEPKTDYYCELSSHNVGHIPSSILNGHFKISVCENNKNISYHIKYAGLTTDFLGRKKLTYFQLYVPNKKYRSKNFTNDYWRIKREADVEQEKQVKIASLLKEGLLKYN